MLHLDVTWMRLATAALGELQLRSSLDALRVIRAERKSVAIDSGTNRPPF